MQSCVWRHSKGHVFFFNYQKYYKRTQTFPLNLMEQNGKIVQFVNMKANQERVFTNHLLKKLANSIQFYILVDALFSNSILSSEASCREDITHNTRHDIFHITKLLIRRRYRRETSLWS